MIFAAGGAMIALLVCFLARSLFVLGPGLLLVGLFNSTYYLGRQSYIVEVVPLICGPARCRPSVARTASACSAARSSGPR